MRFRQETITAIDPKARRVVTDLDRYDADVLVVALGADYDIAATPGLAEAGNEFYTVGGAETLRDLIPSFQTGHRDRGRAAARRSNARRRPARRRCCSTSTSAARGVRDDVRIQVVMPFGVPIPPSPDTSAAILAAFAERDIEFLPDHVVASLDAATNEAVLDDGSRLPYDLFLGIPVHRAPAVVETSGMTDGGWIPVDAGTLATGFPGVYAVGDVTSVGTPKAGMFAEGAARVVADQLIARIRGAANRPATTGRARATSSSVAARSRASTWTSSPPRDTRPAPSSRPRWRRQRRRRRSRRPDALAGSGAEHCDGSRSSSALG